MKLLSDRRPVLRGPDNSAFQLPWPSRTLGPRS
jgi:hypothetical protein